VFGDGWALADDFWGRAVDKWPHMGHASAGSRAGL